MYGYVTYAQTLFWSFWLPRCARSARPAGTATCYSLRSLGPGSTQHLGLRECDLGVGDVAFKGERKLYSNLNHNKTIQKNVKHLYLFILPKTTIPINPLCFACSVRFCPQSGHWQLWQESLSTGPAPMAMWTFSSGWRSIWRIVPFWVLWRRTQRDLWKPLAVDVLSKIAFEQLLDVRSPIEEMGNSKW